MFADHRGKYPVPHLSPREQSILAMLLDEGALGVTEVSRLVDIPGSSAHASLQKLEQSGLVERAGKKRVLTDIGHRIALNL